MSEEGSDFPRPFGPYTLKRKIASGGMAELFLGETTGPGGFSKPVVVKMIHGHLGDDPRFVSMFTDEARILAGFVHGNIVPIFDFGKIEGRTYLVMEFIDGVDLETLLETCRIRGIPLSPRIAVWIGIGVASALQYANSSEGPYGKPLGIVHRDVSPHNVLVSRAGEVKLCDFGIAFSALNRQGTDAGVIKGKLRYLSPEQAREEIVDGRSDVFSLGVTLYELICGHHPMLDASGVTILRILSEGEGYPPLGEAAPWLPASLAGVIDRMMSFDRHSRQADAEEVRRELSSILGAEYGDFSPRELADLVSTVQDEAVRLPHSDQDSKLRAEVASFASEVRTAASQGSRDAGGAGKAIWLARSLLAAAIAGVGVWYLLGVGEDGADRDTGDGGDPVMVETDAGTPTGPVVDTGAGPSDRGPDAGDGARRPDAGREEFAGGSSGPEVSRPRGSGLLVANASPWAEVRIDGKSHGTTPIMDLKLPAGRHRAIFSNPETGEVVRRSFVVKPGKTTKLIVEMSENSE